MAQQGQTVTRPTDDGFYMPAEWCRHARTWAAWPTQSEGSEKTDSLKAVIANAVRNIGRYEPVTVIGCKTDKEEILGACGPKADVMVLPHVSGRFRDTGPTFLVDGKGGSAAVDWQFDGWPGLTADHQSDSILTHALLGEAEIRRFRAPLTLEGTAFCGDGAGTLIASLDAALGQGRNSGVSKLEAFDVLCRWLGVGRILWLEDMIGTDFGRTEVRRSCVFTSPGHVLVGQAESDPVRQTLDAIADRLAKAEDARGHRIHVGRLPVGEIDGHAAAYTTFYVLNQAVLVPQYGIMEDKTALGTISAAFPGRDAIGVDAAPLRASNASLSSLLQYQPARLLERHKATLLPKSAWQRPVPDYVGLLETYIAQVEDEK